MYGGKKKKKEDWPFFLISSSPIFTYMWDLKPFSPKSAERGPDFSGCPFWEQNPQRGTLKMIALSPHVFNTFSCFWRFALRTNSHLWSCYIRSLDRHSTRLQLSVPQSVETVRGCETPFPKTGWLCVIINLKSKTTLTSEFGLYLLHLSTAYHMYPPFSNICIIPDINNHVSDSCAIRHRTDWRTWCTDSKQQALNPSGGWFSPLL